jgi:hypothetical protein
MKFLLGKCVATPGALSLMERHEITHFDLLRRHVRGDWGDLERADKAANDAALVRGGRILSAYDTPGGRLWIISEADRSSTCILLHDEY